MDNVSSSIVTFILTVGLGLVALCFFEAGNAHAQGTNKERENLETQNFATVDMGLRLCKDSACVKCGMFQYVQSINGPAVLYSPTLCELDWKNAQANLKAQKEDEEIRTKYKH